MNSLGLKICLGSIKTQLEQCGVKLFLQKSVYHTTGRTTKIEHLVSQPLRINVIYSASISHYDTHSGHKISSSVLMQTKTENSIPRKILPPPLSKLLRGCWRLKTGNDQKLKITSVLKQNLLHFNKH